VAFWAVLDTSVLYPMPLCDALLWIASTDLYQPLWSEEILDELRRNVSKKVPDADIDWRIDQMTAAFPEAMVEGYESLTPSMTNDVKDRHVLAAAVVGRAQVIVTNNLDDFPEEACAPFGIEPQDADQFLLHCFDLDFDRTVLALVRQADSKHNPPVSLEDLLDLLAEEPVAPRFAAQAREHVDARLAEDPAFLGAIRERAFDLP